ncbi:MAG: phosphomethylpyrimidine synthase ThiC [Armatimonadetes bacterium]|jgi:phosphomethylpyrimidine synthase|nr:phosphomethylpyrimidine synthase ThiC [Armatimonadota bacterium]
MTQLEAARKGRITEEMERVAQSENVNIDVLVKHVAAGSVVIPKNVNRDLKRVEAVGLGLRTKVNANIGTSATFPDIKDELAKLQAALDAGADAVMDLSTGGNLTDIRKAILENCDVALGTVPIYECAVDVVGEHGGIVKITGDDLMGTIERQARQGIDFMTLHCGVTLESISRMRDQGRLMDVTSRGGAFLVNWILANGKENPLYERYDDVLAIARKYDITLSLGDGFRPGCLADATDRAQVQELIILGELVKRAREAGVQAMVEGPGHVPLNQIAANMQIQKSLCEGAPFYVLGPLVTDVAPGYDHITSAIGGAIAAMNGADFICYVTPSEHLGLPTVQDVKEGVIAARIAGHAADIVKGLPGAAEWDRQMAIARKDRDWEKQLELAIDPVKAREVYNKRSGDVDEVCSMCGELCAMKVVEEYLGKTKI